MMMNTEHLRKDTPGCTDKIFLNSAGASLMPDIVVESIKNYTDEEARKGGYKLAELKAEEINGFYTEAARLINCETRNIAFAFNATEAYAKALSSIHFKENDVIITTDNDYVSNFLHFIGLQKRYHIKIVRTRSLENGDLDIQHFKALVEQHHPRLAAITHIPTNSGLVQDVETIGEICERHNILYLLDACQSVGQLVVDVKKLKCDFLSATGRKFLRGPRGTGFLYVSDKILKENYAPLAIDLRGAFWTQPYQYELVETAKRFETWELPYALLIGFKEAIAYANTVGMETIENYNAKLRKQLRENLIAIPGVQVFDKGTKISNILTFRKAGKSLDAAKQHLDAHNVYYSISEKASALIDFTKKGIDWAVRLSPHYFNTMEEMHRVSEIIAEM